MRTRFIYSLLAMLITVSTQAQVNGIWEDIGPFDFPPHENWQIAGVARISQMKFHPTDPNTLYAVNSMGGLFITNDGGENWRTTGIDNLPATRCASVCIDHTDPNVMYFGTGDPSYYSNGLGIWKSTNGGYNFTRKSNGIDNRLPTEILMAPNDRNTLIAATSDGIWKTTNGGDNWNEVKANGDFTDMVYKPGSNDIIYAATKSEFWKSTNGGNNWSRINVPGNGISGGGRIAVSKANANVVYLSFVGNFAGGSTTPVLKSDNSGDSFYNVKKAGGLNLNGYDENSNGQGNYNYALSCDPNNSNHLFACGHIMWESTNGGSTWNKISDSWATQVHTDMHQMPFSPFTVNEVYNVNDGGIWKSKNGGKSFLPICDGLTGTESYVGCQSPVKKEAISIGAQDNGEFIYKDGIWYNNAGGDVHRAMVHDNISADYYYDLSNNNDYKGRRRYLPTGAAINLEMPFSADGNGQDMRTDFPLTNINVGYFAYNDVYRANNLSNNPPTWTKISNFNRRVKALASSPNDANVLYVITDNGQIHRTDNALAGSPNYASYNLPNNTNVTASIAVSKSNANVVYAVCNSKVYRSDNKGANWSEVTGSLPNVNYHTILHDIYSNNEAMYLAGYTTVWYKDNTMNDWMNYSVGLPSVVNFRKIYMYNDGTANSVLTAITDGRSVFRAGLNNKHILRKAENPEDIIPGLVYSYYELAAGYNNIPLYSSMTPTKLGATPYVTSSIKLRNENYGIKFQGYIDIPEDGKYTFYLNSDDGSRMFIGEDLVIDNDGNHGNIERNGYAWLEKGKHIFTITYYQGAGGQDLGFNWEGPSFGKQTVPSNVLYQLSPESVCPENGKISVERWNNINGNSVANIPVNNNPSQTWEASIFESEPTDGDNYGVRYRGFICPPYTGNYTFYVSSDDASEVWVSTDDKPANKQRVCYLNGSVELRNWYKYASQKSAKVYLEAGKQYYVEALHKEGAGGDNFAVAWTTPSGEFQAPIEGKHLSPFTNNNAPTVSLTAPANNSLVEYGSNVTITANASDDGSVTKVEFYINDVLIGSDNSSPYQITWNPDLNGTHKIHARAIDNSGRVTTTAKNTITTYSLRDPENPQFSVNGLDYEYYEGVWTSLPNFYNLFTSAQGTTNTIDLSKAQRDEDFGLVFKGFIDVPTNGYYKFYLDGDDGIQFLIGDEAIITYDGIHGMSNVKTGGAGLKAGKHLITLNYFQGKGGKGISLQYEGPSTAKQNIPLNKWYRETFENAHPTISLTGNSTIIVEPATINLEANATDADGTIDHVNFYQNGESIGLTTGSPYTFTVSNVMEGTHTFTAVAYDNLGDSTVSNNVIIIIDPANIAPTVSITNPIQGETFTGTSNISIEVDANDSDGTISRVELYNGAILITTINNVPFNYLWEDVVEGNYDITAKAFDDDNAVTTSTVISIKVELLTGDLYSAFEENANVLNIYPNPALTATKATITLNEGGTGVLQIVDMRGQVHFSNETLQLSSGINQVDLDASNLSAGQYLLTLQLNGKNYISKLMCGQKPKNNKE